MCTKVFLIHVLMLLKCADWELWVSAVNKRDSWMWRQFNRGADWPNRLLLNMSASRSWLMIVGCKRMYMIVLKVQLLGTSALSLSLQLHKSSPKSVRQFIFSSYSSFPCIMMTKKIIIIVKIFKLFSVNGMSQFPPQGNYKNIPFGCCFYPN